MSEFLFKELFYQEIYFASYNELNDPLDITARIDFSTKKINDINYLIYFFGKSQFLFDDSEYSNQKLVQFFNNNTKFQLLVNEVFNQIKKSNKNNLWINDIISIIKHSIIEAKIDFEFKSDAFEQKLQKLTKKILQNSHIACFSENNTNFLMWSHYASKHSGICMEFNLGESNLFPFEYNGKRKITDGKIEDRFSKGIIESTIFREDLKKVIYQEEPPYINFYDFQSVFENEYDCDLIGLSKSWTHKFALELEWTFSTKTTNWEYENEFRVISINFDESKLPEKRIRHFPIEILSGIYFGLNTPENIKTRIFEIISYKNSETLFYESKLNGSVIEFSEWEEKDKY
ncbi:DUF2971 domain-containing protein [Rhizosphaericola mali]|uniref:DUF2971 domain-containing protein n=1 Tax=Rhizosphaericola mali TaxID=2545455 RepID=A0A5P2FZR5_9BACT|nr:DUF2971 domain-containing protein [Rhizosphaericola mali]QES87349.1 DUF2971 domain-containing protein [Rhizosphaericola mali]